MDVSAFYQIAVLALATAAISLTLTKSHFGEAIRDWMEGRSHWLGLLFSCHYCMSHWIAAGFVAVYRPLPLRAWLPCDLLVSVFATVAIAALVSSLVSLLIRKGNTTQ